MGKLLKLRKPYKLNLAFADADQAFPRANLSLFLFLSIHASV